MQKVLIFLNFCLALFSSNGALAFDFSLIPEGVYENKVTVSVATDYNSNAALIAGAEEGVWQYTVIPKYKLSNFDDLNEWYTDLSLRVIRSSNKEIVIDREDPIFNFGLNRELWIGSLNVNARYEEASSRTTEFNESGIVFNDITRVSRVINSNWQYQLSPRTTLSAGINLSDAKFKGGGANLVGNKNLGYSTSLSYGINENLKAVIQLAVSKFTPDSTQANNLFQPESLNKNYNAGVDWELNEKSNISIRFGTNIISGANAGRGWNGSTTYRYLSERSSVNIDFARSVNPSGLGVLLQSDRLSSGWTYALTDRSGMNLNYSINKNRGLDSTESTQYGASYNYELSDRLRLALNGTYRELENPNNKTNGKIIGFTLTYDHPAF